MGIVLFSFLGTWQVFRAIEKQALQENMENKLSEQVLMLDKKTENIESQAFVQVKAIGHYDKKNGILVENIKYKGQIGYHVLTPFILKQDHSVIMVNRGWIAQNRDRNILPVIDTPQGEREIHGRISPHKSKPPLILGELDTSAKAWLYFDKDIFEKKMGKEILPVVILQDKDDAFGYIREWPKYEEKVGMHIGYAIHWYVFALIVLVTYLGVNIKKR